MSSIPIETRGEVITTALKTLLEEKHLYQYVDVEDRSEFETEDVFIDERTTGAAASSQWEAKRLQHPIFSTWLPYIAARSGYERAKSMFDRAGQRGLTFTAPNVKMHCHRCNNRETFVSLSMGDAMDDGRVIVQPFKSEKGRLQVFAVSYQCQSCQSPPDVLLIRREGLRLSLVGRAPMEVLPVPSYIPRSVQDHFAEGTIANRCGRTLAGIFFMRVVLEQWACRFDEAKVRPADKALDHYMATLPDNFKGQFPSLRELYSDLSEAIHKARADINLFERARSVILEHFEARRLFKLADPRPAPPEEPNGGTRGRESTR